MIAGRDASNALRTAASTEPLGLMLREDARAGQIIREAIERRDRARAVPHHRLVVGAKLAG
jgi:hypothetical protein